MDNPFDSDEGRAQIQRRMPNVDAATVQDYIDDAWAAATSIAPVIAEDTWPPKLEKADAMKAIVRAIILRWHEAQSGAVTGRAQSAGPFAQSIQLDQRPKRGYTLMPSEVVDIQRIARRQGGMFSVDTAPDVDEVPKTFLNGPHFDRPDL